MRTERSPATRPGFAPFWQPAPRSAGAAGLDPRPLCVGKWNVTAEHSRTGVGVVCGKVETAYHEAHDNDGRNLARRVINSQIALAVQIRESTEPEGGRRALLRLATAPGEVSNGVYLYPACSVPSPLAASTNGEGGEHSSTLQSETPLATSPPPIEEAAAGERVYEGDYDYEYSDSYEHKGTDS